MAKTQTSKKVNIIKLSFENLMACYWLQYILLLNKKLYIQLIPC